MKKLTAVFLSLLLIICLVGCSESDTVTECKVAGETYKLDRWERDSDYDSDTTDGYSLIFLSTADSIPVQFSLGSSNSTPTVMLVADVIVDGTSIRAENISASYDKGAGQYISEICYSFALPKGTALPTEGVLHDLTADKDIALDLSALELK